MGYMHSKSLQCVQLFATLWMSGSSVHGILQARILEWAATPSSRGASQLGTQPASLMSPALADGFFTPSTTSADNGTPLQYSCLENPMDGGT